MSIFNLESDKNRKTMLNSENTVTNAFLHHQTIFNQLN